MFKNPTVIIVDKFPFVTVYEILTYNLKPSFIIDFLRFKRSILYLLEKTPSTIKKVFLFRAPSSKRCCTSLLAEDRWRNRLVWLCNRLGSRDATGGEVLGQVSNLLAVTAASESLGHHDGCIYPDWFPSLRSSLGSSFHGPFSILTLIVLVPRCPPASTTRGTFCATNKFASTVSTIGGVLVPLGYSIEQPGLLHILIDFECRSKVRLAMSAK